MLENLSDRLDDECKKLIEMHKSEKVKKK